MSKNTCVYTCACVCVYVCIDKFTQVDASLACQN